MDETAFYLFFAAFLLVLVVVILEFIKIRLTQKRERQELADLQPHMVNTRCRSPGCFRCTRNREILQTALTRLSYYTSDDRDASIKNDLEHISLDIRHSMDLLKNQEQTKFAENTIAVRSSAPVVFKMSGLREEEIWSLDEFAALQLLERHFKEITLEFVHLYKSPLPETQCLWKTNITSSGKWEILQLVDQGTMTKAAEFCPITMEVLKKIPYFMESNIFANASFSVVHPKTHIAAHCGSTNCRIRCHLGLKVPNDECALQVGDKTVFWEEKKMICFNDAFPHSVVHKGGDDSDIRAVFMIDMWHPDVTESQRKILNFAFSS